MARVGVAKANISEQPHGKGGRGEKRKAVDRKITSHVIAWVGSCEVMGCNRLQFQLSKHHFALPHKT